jgi:hypothetical protein
MFRLAGHLGMTVSELENRMSSKELTEWILLAWLDPWGEYRADVRGAVAAWASVASWSSECKVQDFLPVDPCEEKPVRTPAPSVKEKPGVDELTLARNYLTSLGLVPIKDTDHG